jgi:hypothetical protein
MKSELLCSFDAWNKMSRWRAARAYEKSKEKGITIVVELSFYVKNEPSLINPENCPLVAALRDFSNLYPCLEEFLREKYPAIKMHHIVKIRPTDVRSGIVIGGFKNEPLVTKRILKSALKNLRKPFLMYKTYSINRNALML